MIVFLHLECSELQPKTIMAYLRYRQTRQGKLLESGMRESQPSSNETMYTCVLRTMGRADPGFALDEGGATF